MPTYVYESCSCPEFKEEFGDVETVEHNTKIDYRDLITCGFCGAPMNRKVVFTGLTWAPTAGGMR